MPNERITRNNCDKCLTTKGLNQENMRFAGHQWQHQEITQCKQACHGCHVLVYTVPSGSCFQFLEKCGQPNNPFSLPVPPKDNNMFFRKKNIKLSLVFIIGLLISFSPQQDIPSRKCHRLVIMVLTFQFSVVVVAAVVRMCHNI